MQNLKSLDNLLTKPVLGANDDTLAMVGRKQQDIYSYEDEVKLLLTQVDEDHRKVLSRQLLVASYQD